MSEDSGEEKNLAPTEHHLEKLREKGNFPLSDDFHAAAASVAKVLVLYFGASAAGNAMASLLERPFQLPVSPGSTLRIAKESLFLFVTIFFVVSGSGIVAYIVARGVDGGGLKPHLEKVSIKFSNLDPVKGIKNKFKMRSLFELLKGIIKVLILGGSFTYICWPHVGAILYTAGCDLRCSGPLISDIVLKFIFVFLVLQIASAAFDIKLVRQLFEAENKMSHSDKKREGRDMDGDPAIKQEQASFRNSLLELSGSRRVDADVGEDTPDTDSEDSKRRIVVFDDGAAVTIEVNFSGEFKPILVDRFDYRGEAPPRAADLIMVKDVESVKALANVALGQPVPMHVMRRLLEVTSAGDSG